MSDEIRELFYDYLKRVNDACENLIKEINRTSTLALRDKMDLLTKHRSEHHTPFEINSTTYFYHGSGMRMINADVDLDWDFCTGKGWASIDPWKVARSMKISDGNKLYEACMQAVKEGQMSTPDNSHFFFI